MSTDREIIRLHDWIKRVEKRVGALEDRAETPPGQPKPKRSAFEKTIRDDDAARLLGNLLARIHRDGGQYADAVGIAQAAREADAKVAEWLVSDDVILALRAEMAEHIAARRNTEGELDKANRAIANLTTLFAQEQEALKTSRELGELLRMEADKARREIANLIASLEEANRNAKAERGDHQHTLKKYEALVAERDRERNRAAKLDRECNRLAEFKAYVHARLDEKAVPTHPPDAIENRIGWRLDFLFKWLDDAEARVIEWREALTKEHAAHMAALARIQKADEYLPLLSNKADARHLHGILYPPKKKPRKKVK